MDNQSDFMHGYNSGYRDGVAAQKKLQHARDTKPKIVMCQSCSGRGKVDDPPWSIQECEDCRGLGRITIC